MSSFRRLASIPREARPVFGALVAAALLCAGPRAVSAQQADSTLRSVLVRAHLENWLVQLRGPTLSPVAGRILQLSDTAALLVGGASARLDEITRVERGGRGHRGAVVGAIVAAVALGALAYGFSGLSDSLTHTQRVEGAAVTALGGAFMGFILGGMIHPGPVHWKPAWPSP